MSGPTAIFDVQREDSDSSKPRHLAHDLDDPEVIARGENEQQDCSLSARHSFQTERQW
jgi:hypothetical protein